MNVLKMIIRQLVANNVDGLYNPIQDCGCLLNDDFAPCNKFPDYPGPFFNCEVGIEISCDCGEHDYHVGPVK